MRLTEGLDMPDGLVRKAAALGMALTALYPAITVARVFCFQTGGGAWLLALCGLWMLAGFLTAGRILTGNYGLFRLLTVYALIMIPIGTGALLFFAFGMKRSLFEAAVQGLFCFLGIRACLPPGHGTGFMPGRAVPPLYAGWKLTWSVLLLAAALVVSHYWSAVSSLRGAFYLSAFTFLFFALFLRYEENLGMIFFQRSVQQPEARGKIRRNGRITVLAIYAAVLLFFNLKTLVVFVINGLRMILHQIAEWVLWLIGLLLRHKHGNYSETFGFIPFDPSPSPYPLVVFLLYFTGYSLAFLALYLLLPVLFKKCRELFHRICQLVRRLLGWRAHRGIVGQEEYQESVEIVRASSKGKGARASGLSVERLLKSLKGMEDPVKRVRLMYAIILRSLIHCGLGVRPSDTTSEIAGKAAGIGEVEECIDEITGIYDRVRYGGKTPQTVEVLGAEDCMQGILDHVGRGRIKR